MQERESQNPFAKEIEQIGQEIKTAQEQLAQTTGDGTLARLKREALTKDLDLLQQKLEFAQKGVNPDTARMNLIVKRLQSELSAKKEELSQLEAQPSSAVRNLKLNSLKIDVTLLEKQLEYANNGIDPAVARLEYSLELTQQKIAARQSELRELGSTSIAEKLRRETSQLDLDLLEEQLALISQQIEDTKSRTYPKPQLESQT